MKSNLLLLFACLYTMHATWDVFLMSETKIQKSWFPHLLFHSNFFPQKFQRLHRKINVYFKPFNTYSVLHLLAPSRKVFYFHLFVSFPKAYSVKKEVQKEIRSLSQIPYFQSQASCCQLTARCILLRRSKPKPCQARKGKGETIILLPETT